MRPAYERLEKLYATLPVITCQGLCQEACGPLMMSKLEAIRLHDAGHEVSAPISKDCECSLLVEEKCSAYDIRPAICRLFGLTEDLQCPFGCKSSRTLTVAESHAFLRRIDGCAGRRQQGHIFTGERETLIQIQREKQRERISDVQRFFI